MTGAEFNRAVAILQSTGALPSGDNWKTAMAKLLGLSRPMIYKFQNEGTDQRHICLAISALIHDLDPWPQERLGRPSPAATRKEQP